MFAMIEGLYQFWLNIGWGEKVDFQSYQNSMLWVVLTCISGGLAKGISSILPQRAEKTSTI
jgi:hypothetical protein